MPECQGTPCWKQVRYLQNNSKRIQTHNYLVGKWILNHLVKLIELFCEYLSVWCIWLYVIIMSRTRFRVNLHSTVAWMSRQSLIETGAISGIYMATMGFDHFVCKWTLNHLAKLAKWLSWVVGAYLFGAFDCVLLSCHVCISEGSNPLAGT